MRRRAGPKVFLIGFMGSGKSAVGAALAARLGLPFVDTDAEVARAAGRPIARIFRDSGEKRFRALEARQIARASRGPAAVVAAGGGAVLLAENVARMRAVGRVVWLRAAGRTLWARVRRDGLASRPLLAAAGPRGARKALLALLSARVPLYRRASHVAVSSAGGPVAAARRVAAALRRAAR